MWYSSPPQLRVTSTGPAANSVKSSPKLTQATRNKKGDEDEADEVTSHVPALGSKEERVKKRSERVLCVRQTRCLHVDHRKTERYRARARPLSDIFCSLYLLG